jgi:hypothetical protein
MYRLAIIGKANTGKNTVGTLLVKSLSAQSAKFIAFADPLKQMACIAFPEIPRKWLYGSSKYRNEVIPGAFKDGVPLTVRQLLIELGNDFGRKYKRTMWIDNFYIRLEKAYLKNPEVIVVTDCRFRNEFDFLKSEGFFQIKILRDTHIKINDISETNQDGILNSEFDAIIDNNGTKAQLKYQVNKIVAQLQ